MKKKHRDIVVNGEQYAWTCFDYILKIWKDKKVIMDFDLGFDRVDYDDDKYVKDFAVTPRMIVALITAKNDKDRKEIIKFGTNSPYIFEDEVITHRHYNPYFGDERMCKCGHSYHRHFDHFETEVDYIDAGCKYCGCVDFEEVENEE